MGLIGSPFGIEGFVKVRSFSGEQEHFVKLKSVTLRKKDKEEIYSEEIYTIEEVSIKGSNLLIKFSGINNPEEAALITGSELITDRKHASRLSEGEYYIEDLKGIEVFNTQGEKLGIIENILEGGGGNLAEIVLISGVKHFVPFRKEFFDEPNMKKNSITLLESWILE